MKTPAQMTRTAKLAEGGMMIAMAYVLSMIPAIDLVYGGSTTFFSTLPIILMGLRHGTKWGVGTAAAYSLTQLLQGIAKGSLSYLPTITALVLCALLDYIIAYTVIGFSGTIAHKFKNVSLGIGVGVAATGALRLLCSFISGIVLWSEYAPEGTPVWLYSIGYNASWCVPDVLVALVAAVLLSRVKVLHLGGEAGAKKALSKSA